MMSSPHWTAYKRQASECARQLAVARAALVAETLEGIRKDVDLLTLRAVVDAAVEDLEHRSEESRMRLIGTLGRLEAHERSREVKSS